METTCSPWQFTAKMLIARHTFLYTNLYHADPAVTKTVSLDNYKSYIQCTIRSAVTIISLKNDFGLAFV